MSAQYIRCGTQCHAGDFDAGTLIQGRLPEDGQALLARFGGQVQMVYLDPPFNTGKKFDMKVRVGEKGYKTGSPTMSLAAYDDRWESREEYLAMMREALVIARGLLKKEGYDVGFPDFMRIGVPYTLTAVVVGYLFIWFVWA